MSESHILQANISFLVGENDISLAAQDSSGQGLWLVKDTLRITREYNAQVTAEFTIADNLATHVKFGRGERVRITNTLPEHPDIDPEVLFCGFVSKSVEKCVSPKTNPTIIEHKVTCVSLRYLADKRLVSGAWLARTWNPTGAKDKKGVSRPRYIWEVVYDIWNNMLRAEEDVLEQAIGGPNGSEVERTTGIPDDRVTEFEPYDISIGEFFDRIAKEHDCVWFIEARLVTAPDTFKRKLHFYKRSTVALSPAFTLTRNRAITDTVEVTRGTESYRNVQVVRGAYAEQGKVVMTDTLVVGDDRRNIKLGTWNSPDYNPPLKDTVEEMISVEIGHMKNGVFKRNPHGLCDVFPRGATFEDGYVPSQPHFFFQRGSNVLTASYTDPKTGLPLEKDLPLGLVVQATYKAEKLVRSRLVNDTAITAQALREMSSGRVEVCEVDESLKNQARVASLAKNRLAKGALESIQVSFETWNHHVMQAAHTIQVDLPEHGINNQTYIINRAVLRVSNNVIFQTLTCSSGPPLPRWQAAFVGSGSNGGGAVNLISGSSTGGAITINRPSITPTPYPTPFADDVVLMGTALGDTFWGRIIGDNDGHLVRNNLGELVYTIPEAGA
jgi:hypothetical protein